jgi:antitoxin VapB
MTTRIFYNGRSQAVRIPKALRFQVEEVAVRRLGDGIYVEPVKSTTWPEGWFDDILIEDVEFKRPEQGGLPPPVSLDANPE